MTIPNKLRLSLTIQDWISLTSYIRLLNERLSKHRAGLALYAVRYLKTKIAISDRLRLIIFFCILSWLLIVEMLEDFQRCATSSNFSFSKASILFTSSDWLSSFFCVFAIFITNRTMGISGRMMMDLSVRSASHYYTHILSSTMM